LTVTKRTISFFKTTHFAFTDFEPSYYNYVVWFGDLMELGRKKGQCKAGSLIITQSAVETWGASCFCKKNTLPRRLKREEKKSKYD